MTQIRVGAIEALTVLQNVITEDFDVVEAVAVRTSVPELFPSGARSALGSSLVT